MTRPAHLAIASVFGLMAATASAAIPGGGGDIVIRRVGQQPSAPGSEAHFASAVRVDGPFQGTPPSRITGATVIFEPGARTAWHTHPLGQTLIVTAGIGLVQRSYGPVAEIHYLDFRASLLLRPTANGTDAEPIATTVVHRHNAVGLAYLATLPLGHELVVRSA